MEVTQHFAGYFDELGVTIELDPGTNRGTVIEMKDQLFDSLAAKKFPFKWMVSLSKRANHDERYFQTACLPTKELRVKD